jgi:A/G-specific adenine glycosylase
VIETDKVEDFEYVYGQVQENYLKIMSWLVLYIMKKVSFINYRINTYIKFWKVSSKGVVENGINNEDLKHFRSQS